MDKDMFHSEVEHIKERVQTIIDTITKDIESSESELKRNEEKIAQIKPLLDKGKGQSLLEFYKSGVSAIQYHKKMIAEAHAEKEKWLKISKELKKNKHISKSEIDQIIYYLNTNPFVIETEELSAFFKYIEDEDELKQKMNFNATSDLSDSSFEEDESSSDEEEE